MFDDVHSDPSFYQDCCEPESDKSPEIYRQMTFSFDEASDDDTTKLFIDLTNDSTEYLPTIMDKFQTFLRAAGFDYVTLVDLGEGKYGYGSVNAFN